MHRGREMQNYITHVCARADYRGDKQSSKAFRFASLRDQRGEDEGDDDILQMLTCSSESCACIQRRGKLLYPPVQLCFGKRPPSAILSRACVVQLQVGTIVSRLVVVVIIYLPHSYGGGELGICPSANLLHMPRNNVYRVEGGPDNQTRYPVVHIRSYDVMT